MNNNFFELINGNFFYNCRKLVFKVFLCISVYAKKALGAVTSIRLSTCSFSSTSGSLWIKFGALCNLWHPAVAVLSQNILFMPSYEYHWFYRSKLAGSIFALAYLIINLPAYFLLVKMLPYCLFFYFFQIVQKTIFAVHSFSTLSCSQKRMMDINSLVHASYIWTVWVKFSIIINKYYIRKSKYGEYRAIFLRSSSIKVTLLSTTLSLQDSAFLPSTGFRIL